MDSRSMLARLELQAIHHCGIVFSLVIRWRRVINTPMIIRRTESKVVHDSEALRPELRWLRFKPLACKVLNLPPGWDTCMMHNVKTTVLEGPHVPQHTITLSHTLRRRDETISAWHFHNRRGSASHHSQSLPR